MANIVVLLMDYLTGDENWAGMGGQAFKWSQGEPAWSGATPELEV